MKTTYRSPEEKSPVQNPDWKAISSFNLKEDPFQWVREELDQVQSQYSKLELVTKGASKLLGDCKVRNIVKELKKLKHNDTASLEATNAILSSQVVELKMTLVLKEDKIQELNGEKAERLKRIQEAIGHLGDVMNKACLYDDDVRAEGQLSAQKIIIILVKFGHKMKTILGEIRKLLSRSLAEGSSRPLV